MNLLHPQNVAAVLRYAVCFTFCWLLAMCYSHAQAPDYDYYIVMPNGDTLRDNIEVIHLEETRKGRHVAKVTYQNDSVQRFFPGEIIACGFLLPKILVGNKPSKKGGFVQVQAISFVDDGTPNTMRFYRPVQSCNGHTLYLHYNERHEDGQEYLVTKGIVMYLQLKGYPATHRKILQQLMPDCFNEIAQKLWPRWAAEQR